MARVAALAVFIVLSTLPILAQEAGGTVEERLKNPAPPIVFDPWQAIERGEFFNEFEAAFPTPEPSGVAANDTVRLRCFMPTESAGPVPVVVMLHYWGATNRGLERQAATDLCSRGIAVVSLALPYHLERTPPGSRSGEQAVTPDPAALVRTMVQSVQDVKRTVDWIESRPEFDRGRVGIAGVSLGGVVASLAFAVENRFQSAAFMLAGADLAGLLWNSSRVIGQRDALRRAGYTETKLRQELVEIEPLGYLPDAPPRPSLVIVADLDTVVPARCSDALIEALHEPQVTRIGTGHYGGALVQRRLVRTVARFLGETLLGRDYRAPASVSAPTLRVGLLYSEERSLQFAAGIDLWRGSRGGSTFGSVLGTPQGIQGFAGVHLGRGLSLGVVVLPRRPVIGAFWSTVL
jgi:dienelactone hydrolase